MINFEERLQKLKDRRQGTFEQAICKRISEGRHYAFSKNLDDRQPEFFEKIKEPKGVQYVLGAMEAVSTQYTEESKTEGNRVANELIAHLKSDGISASKRLQGSVALDIHLEKHSDVDMLVLLDSQVIVESPVLNTSSYTPFVGSKTIEDFVKELREKSEQILSSIHFTCVNIQGNKSIALECDRLIRKIDIVPSCWYDTRQYQASQRESDRGVYIYEKSQHKLHCNYPFTHINNVNQRDMVHSGNLKRVIRLMKTIVADMKDNDKQQIAKKLSSYDLAAIAYHMNDALLFTYPYMRLSLLENTRSHLERLLLESEYRNSLYVPDETRKIFNDANKIDALAILFNATTELARAVSTEISPSYHDYNASAILKKSVIY